MNVASHSFNLKIMKMTFIWYKKYTYKVVYLTINASVGSGPELIYYKVKNYIHIGAMCSEHSSHMLILEDLYIYTKILVSEHKI